MIRKHEIARRIGFIQFVDALSLAGEVSPELKRLMEITIEGLSEKDKSPPVICKVSWQGISAREAFNYANYDWDGEAGTCSAGYENEGEIQFLPIEFTLERYLIAIFFRSVGDSWLSDPFEAYPFATYFPLETGIQPEVSMALEVEKRFDALIRYRVEAHANLSEKVSELANRLDALEKKVAGPIYETMVGLDQQLKALSVNLGHHTLSTRQPVYPNPSTDEIKRLQMVYENHLQLAARYEGRGDREMAGIEMARARKIESELRRLGA